MSQPKISKNFKNKGRDFRFKPIENYLFHCWVKITVGNPNSNSAISLEMMRFCFKIVHVPGPALVTADALSRSPVDTPSAAVEEKVELTDYFLCMDVNALPATQKSLAGIKAELAEDPVFVTTMNYVKRGWPQKSKLSP